MFEKLRRRKQDHSYPQEITEAERLQRLQIVEEFLLKMAQRCEYDSLLEKQLRERMDMKTRHIEEFNILLESFKAGSTEGLSQLTEGKPTNLDSNSRNRS